MLVLHLFNLVLYCKAQILRGENKGGGERGGAVKRKLNK